MNKIESHKDLDRFLSDLKTFDVSENPFLSFAFLSVYLKYYPNGNFRFYYVYDNDNLIGIVPFECTYNNNLLKVEKLRFIGYRQFNYEQYICRDEDMELVHTYLMDYLSSLKHSVVLNIYDINNASPLYDILSKSPLQKKALKLYSCPCLQFTDDFEEFFKTAYTSSKKRAELKKFQKKVNELGDFKIVNVVDKESYDNNKKYLDQIYKVHAERFAGVYATSFFGSQKMRPYYSDLIKSLMYGERGHISLLILDNVVIAFIFCLTNGKVLIDWIPAFDPAFAKYSLGIVQYKMLFEDICKQGKYKLFDYSKGSSVYKRKWAKEETSNYQFIITLPNANFAAYLIFTFDCWKFGIKVWMRNHGLLSKIKHLLGSLRKPAKAETRNYSILYSDSQKSNFVFNYSDINTFPVECRLEVINALYQGATICDIKKDESGITILMKNKV